MTDYRELEREMLRNFKAMLDDLGVTDRRGLCVGYKVDPQEASGFPLTPDFIRSTEEGMNSFKDVVRAAKDDAQNILEEDPNCRKVYVWPVGYTLALGYMELSEDPSYQYGEEVL